MLHNEDVLGDNIDGHVNLILMSDTQPSYTVQKKKRPFGLKSKF